MEQRRGRHVQAELRLAERLLELAGVPAGSTVFFANSGTEANEAAFKLARRAQPLRSMTRTPEIWPEWDGGGI